MSASVRLAEPSIGTTFLPKQQFKNKKKTTHNKIKDILVERQ
jgi:hypothetical protein